MKVVCVMVSSLNGKITNGTDPHIYTWTSKEDQDHFFSLIEHASCIIMGRNTYEQAKDIMKHKEGRLRVVLTSTPDQFQGETIPGQLEFTNESPSKLLTRLAEKGIQEALLVGGATTNTAFLQENCIDELWLTVEPIIFGTGTPLFTEDILEKRLMLQNIERLNNKGTLFLQYTFLKQF